MAKTKRTKPSKKPTTKGKDLPESVQWLLGFANLGSKPGEPNPLPGKIIDYKGIKRPPVDPPPPGSVEDDKNGHIWVESTDGTLMYCGKVDGDPSLKEFKDFLKKTKIKRDKADDYTKGRFKDSISPINYAWRATCDSITSKMNIKADLEDLTACEMCAEHFVYDRYKYRQIPIPKPDDWKSGKLINGLEYHHDNVLTQVTCAYILDFWHNQRELHQHLRQCKCCGKFWIEAKTRKKYCCKKCEDRFNQASRQAVRESLKTQRKKQGKDKKEITHNEIINWLCNDLDFKSKDAEKEYEDEKRRNSNNVKSLSNFKRTYGKRNGLI